MADSFPPSCLDRADGEIAADGTLMLGTPTPANQPQYYSGDTSFIFEEDANSPSIERGEQATIVKTFHCDPTTAQILITGLNRGTIQQDSFGDITRILTARLDQERLGKCKITVTSESVSFDSPPDQFSAEVMEFNAALFRHPLFLPILNYNVIPGTYNQPVDNTQSIGPAIISAIIQVANQSTQQAANSWQSVINNVTNGEIITLANLLQTKYQQGIDSFYLAGYKITWSQFYFLMPEMTPGGYIEDPISSGWLPPYFWSSDASSGGFNQFLAIAEILDLATYQGGISWLRLADSVQYERTWMKITRQWLGGPSGHWDPDLYPSFGV